MYDMPTAAKSSREKNGKIRERSLEEREASP